MAVSPYPSSTATVALAAARKALREAVGSPVPADFDPDDADSPQPTISDARIDALGAAASAEVERFAPDAPAAVRCEATLRLAAWLQHRRPQAFTSISAGSVRLDYVKERFYAPAGLANSGARTMLEPGEPAAPWQSRSPTNEVALGQARGTARRWRLYVNVAGGCQCRGIWSIGIAARDGSIGNLRGHVCEVHGCSRGDGRRTGNH